LAPELSVSSATTKRYPKFIVPFRRSGRPPQHCGDNPLVSRAASIEVVVVFPDRQYGRYRVDVRAEHNVRLSCECDDVETIVSYILAFDFVAETSEMRFEKLLNLSSELIRTGSTLVAL
jgi:hypothetical protein